MNVMSYVRLTDVSNGDTVRIRKGFRKGRLIKSLENRSGFFADSKKVGRFDQFFIRYERSFI